MSAISANSALAGAQVASKRSAVKAKAAFNVSASAKVDACDKNSVIVSPSILSANFATLGAEVRPQPPRDCDRKAPRPPVPSARAREAIAARWRSHTPAVRARAEPLGASRRIDRSDKATRNRASVT